MKIESIKQDTEFSQNNVISLSYLSPAKETYVACTTIAPHYGRVGYICGGFKEEDAN